MTKSKKQAKKLKKSKAEEKGSIVINETLPVAPPAPEHKASKESKKRKRNNKISKSASPALQAPTPPSSDGSSSIVKKQKKKKKSHKRKNKELEETDASAADASVQVDHDSPLLEGNMINDQMVLIDRKLGKVYSATDRLENGDRNEIGKLGEDGTFVLFTSTASATPGVPDFPFATDADDHCESPLLAYQDVVPFLNACGNKSPSQLSIYDPYFCNGTVVKNMESLGFPNVYNRKEDCYHVWSSPSSPGYPKHDILVTNPPYSADHIEKLVEHITSSAFGTRPWMLLLPQWVHKKDYWSNRTKHIRPFYVIPRKRYVYLPPASFREAKKSDVHKKSSPFVSMWYIWGGTQQQNEKWVSLAQRIPDSDMARSKSALRDLRRKGNRKK